MDDAKRKNVLILAISAPILTALVMGTLIIRKLVVNSAPEPEPVVHAEKTTPEARFQISEAYAGTPDDMIKAADAAERTAGGPFVESCLLRAEAARRKLDSAGERAALDQALALDPARPDSQTARALFAAEAWAREAAPSVRIHPVELALVEDLLIPPSPAVDPALDRLEGRAGKIVSLLKSFRDDPKQEEISVLWSSLTSGGIEDRLAFAMGVESLRLGSLKDALIWLQTAISARVEDPARLRCFCLAGLLAGDTYTKDALTLIKRWSEAGGAPRPDEALAWWAVAAKKLGDEKEARSKLDEASALNPAWRSARGWLAYHQGDRARALEDAEARRDSDPWARYLRALIHWDAGEIDGALAECGKLLEGWPDHYEAIVLQARGLMARGRNEKAEERWRTALKIAAGRTEARLGLAEFYAATGRRDEAIQAFVEIQGVAAAHSRGAQLMLDLGRHAEALKWAQVGVARFPNDVGVRTVLSRILHARLDHFSERAQLEVAAQLAPDDPQVKKQLAECMEEMKRE